jgi:hypothetical protein
VPFWASDFGHPGGPGQYGRPPTNIAPPPEGPVPPAKNWLDSACSLPHRYLERVRRGVVKGRSPDIIFVPREPDYFGAFSSMSHSGPWDYLQQVPIVFYGPGFIRSTGPISLPGEIDVTDIAPTLADLLHVPWPKDRPGHALTQALLPPDRRAHPEPKMILEVVWDGGGTQVLHAWPDQWPFLRSIMHKGSYVDDAIVGTSPSVTPAVHASLGTGTFPKQHGIVDIPIRLSPTKVVGSYAGDSPQYLRVKTLADMYDQMVGNEAKIGMLAYKNWHLGMMGHGAEIPGGDKDYAVLIGRDRGDLKTNPAYYSLPSYLKHVPGFDDDVRRIDLEDGKADNTWMGHKDILQDPRERRHTPVWILYQTKLIETLMKREGFGADAVPDMFFVNYKQIDDAGHDWNMLFPEMKDTLHWADEMLRHLVTFLNRTVGKQQWVLALTADHGQGPDVRAVGAWPIHMGVLVDDVAKHFGIPADELFQDTRPVGFWVNPKALFEHGVTLEQISNYLVHYRLEDNSATGIPKMYQDRLKEPIFAAAFPADKMGTIWHACGANR